MESLFEKFVKQINETKTEKLETCQHKNVIIDNESKFCSDCGEELELFLNHNFDFQNRVQKRLKKLSIGNDVKIMEFSRNIICKANDVFELFSKGEIFMGKKENQLFLHVYILLLKKAITIKHQKNYKKNLE